MSCERLTLGVDQQPAHPVADRVLAVSGDEHDVGSQTKDHMATGAEAVSVVRRRLYRGPVSCRYGMEPTPGERASREKQCRDTRSIRNAASEQLNQWRHGAREGRGALSGSGKSPARDRSQTGANPPPHTRDRTDGILVALREPSLKQVAAGTSQTEASRRMRPEHSAGIPVHGAGRKSTSRRGRGGRSPRR